LQPALGGTSPFVNPGRWHLPRRTAGPTRVPSFISANGPVREARFVKNPTERRTAAFMRCLPSPTGPAPLGARSPQPDFATQLSNRNVIFRIPTPTFGAGLIEQIPDAAIACEPGEQHLP